MLPTDELKQLALAAVIGATSERRLQNPLTSGLAVLSCFMGLAGLGFLTAAGYSALALYYDEPTATLYTGLIATAIALAAAITSYGGFRQQRQQAKSYQAQMVETIHKTMDAIAEELEDPIHENPKMAAAVATLAGYIAGKKFL